MRTRQRPQRMLADDPVARQVAGPGFLFTPGAELTQNGKLGARQLPGQLGIAIDLVRIDLAAQVGHQFGAIFQDPGVFLVGKLWTQFYENFSQMHGIFGGIADLGFGKRALQPVGTGFPLGQVDAEHFLHQPRIAHGKTKVQISGSQLRIEQRRRQAAGQA
ncbi:hypothetical protein D3C73_595720 [compost metagenome]